MIIIDNVTGVFAPVPVRDLGRSAPSFTVTMSSTGTIVIYQGDEPDKLESIGTITEAGVYDEAAIKDFFAVEVVANGGSITVTSSNIYA